MEKILGIGIYVDDIDIEGMFYVFVLWSVYFCVKVLLIDSI